MTVANHSIKKILVPTDFSETSMCAFLYARAQAKACGASVELLNVLSSPVVPIAMFEYLPSEDDIENIRHDLRTQSDRKLNEIAKKHFPDCAVTTTTVHGLGAAADLIVEVARQGVDLIVMATHGHGFLGRIALGSVAERVLRDAPCSVMLVPAQEETKRAGGHLPIRKVFVTTDFSPGAQAGIVAAEQQAKMFDASITIGHVVEHPIPPELFDAQILVLAPESERLFQQYREGFESQLKTVAKSIKAKEVIPVVVDKTHSIANSLAEYARESKADLIVVAAKGVGNRLNLVGGVAERIVRQAPCPVLIAHARN